MAVSNRTQKCQMGQEVNSGTAVAASTIWLGTVRMTDETELTFVEESIGNYAGYGSTYIAKEGAAIDFESVPASYEQLGYMFDAGLSADSTSSSGALFIHTHYMSSTSAQTITTYTLEVGDNEDVEEAEYCFCESFQLSGSVDEAVMLTSTWRGRQANTATFTAALTRPNTERLIMNTGQLYVDDNTIGTTQITQSFRSFTLNVNTGWRPVQTADGNLYFTFAKVVDPEITLEITAEHDATWDSAGEKTNWRNQTERLVRLHFAGSSGRRLDFDIAGKWESFSPIEEEDGNSILRGTLRGYYSTSDTLFGTVALVNLLETLP
jgi:hypothetical protein